MSSSLAHSPPRAPPIKYKAPLGTRWQKEKAAAGAGAFEYPDDAKFVGPWIIGECVGKGASGHVKIARHRRTGELAAVKILPLQPFVNSRASLNSQTAKSEKQRLGIDREITMMKLMNHPNIMRIYDVYEGERELYLILEYVEGGELFDFLVNRGKLPPLEALGYFKQIVYGLNYAHTFSIIHRDLKPENILIHSLNPPLVKIADWGMAAFAPPTLQLETSCGSPHYASPEIVNGHKYCGTATDIWSCGVILYALLTGRLPFDDKNVRALLGKVKMGKYEMPSFIDPLAKDLLSRMLVVDVKQRITMSEILAHPWLEGCTPGITYVPAPPVSELARPLQSYLHIDRDLFESLCVIWGRHADPDVIKADLLSPAGQGTLAKAFYFLLHKHREKTMEEHGILMDVNEVMNSPGKVVTKQYAAPRARAKTVHLDVQGAADGTRANQLRSSRAAPAPPSRSPSPNTLAIRIPAPAPMDRAPSRPHPPSPIGPRPQKPRPTSSPAPYVSSNGHPYTTSSAVNHRPGHSLFSAAGGRPAVARAYTSEGPHLSGPPAGMFVPHRPLPPTLDRSVAVSAPGFTHPRVVPSAAPSPLGNSTLDGPAGIIHAPVPVQATSPGLLPMITAPRVPDAQLQKAFDEYATMVNMQAASYNATVAREQIQSPDGHVPAPTAIQAVQQLQAQTQVFFTEPLPTHHNAAIAEPSAPLGHRHANDDKENWDCDATTGKKHSHTDASQSSGGLGFGPSVPMGREMANMVYIKDSVSKEPMKERKERRSRPPTLEFATPASLHKRATFSMIGSPTLMSPPSTMIGSPVVEFKGWFSNLFHWKTQTYVLYSIEDMVTTRGETARLLEQFGVVIALEDNQISSALKCRVDDVFDGNTIVQKQMRFRVEFTTAVCSSQFGPGATPRLSRDPMSPHSSALANSMRSRKDIERMAGYETAAGLVLEKGAMSTFKIICQRLRSEWRLDALQSPRASVMGTPSLDQRLAA